MNAQDGTFPTPTGVSMNRPDAVAAAPLRFAGLADLAIARGNDARVDVVLHDGNGLPTTTTSYPTDRGPVFVALGDLNGDGVTDIVTANADASTVSVLLGY